MVYANRAKGFVVGAVVAVLVVAAFAVAPSFAGAAGARSSAWWSVMTGARPSVLEPEGSGELVLTAENAGDADANPNGSETRIVDKLPAGLKVAGVYGAIPYSNTRKEVPCKAESESQVSCTFANAVVPYEAVEVRIGVTVAEGARSGEPNTVSVSGGEAPDASVSQPVTIGVGGTPFGVQDYSLVNEVEGGFPDLQAGSHPFQSTTTIELNQTADSAPLDRTPNVEPAALAKDLSFRWPPGLIGNPTPVPRCTSEQFLAVVGDGDENECPPDTAVGVATVTVNEPSSFDTTVFTVPLFNLEPLQGEPARFGFNIVEAAAPVYIDPSVRTGGDYGITVSTDNITQTAGFMSAQVSVWGVPGNPEHDAQRGWGCLLEARGLSSTQPCNPLGESRPPSFLSLPTSCGEATQSTVEGDAWAQPAPRSLKPLATFALPPLDGCNELQFNPEIKVAADGEEASKPSGLTVDVHVPQEATANGTGLANSNIRDIAVALPKGVTVNPSDANGLESCSDALVGYLPGESTPPSELRFTSFLPGSTAALAAGDEEPLAQGKNFCPDASKVGTVKIKTPLLPNPLEGAVYLAAQNENPFGSLIAMYIVAEDPVSGSLVKLAGKVSLIEGSDQLVSTFENTPQVAFEDAELHFFGGERAPLSTPAFCSDTAAHPGPYETQATFTPWSGNPPVDRSSAFQITSGPNGSACPGTSLPFDPSLTAGTINNQAGGFSPFTMTMSREDGQQNLKSIELKMPEGLSGVLAGIPLCGEPQADEGLCPAGSQIGETTVSVGVGGDPYSVKGGKVYLTGPYEGAPFGLSIVNPAKAGPFDLEDTPTKHPACDCLVVRAKLEVNPTTTAVTVTSDESGPYAIPSSIEGIPLQIQHVNVTVDRGGGQGDFTFNPTNCEAQEITGKLTSIEGATSSLKVPFRAANCASLKFEPKVTASVSGQVSKANGTSFKLSVTKPDVQGEQADLKKFKIELPVQLPSRLTTLQKACTSAQFEANPAGCPAASAIGFMKADTPLLPVPVEGPMYFVSHGGEAWPQLEIVLQGYGVKVILVGQTHISSSGITSSTFDTIPDVPFSAAEVELHNGPYSALTGDGNLCAPTITTTVKKKVKVKVKRGGHVHTKKVTRKVKETKPTTLSMPTELVAQSGATISRSTPVTVTGCPKATTVHKQKKKAKKHARKHGGKGKGRS